MMPLTTVALTSLSLLATRVSHTVAQSAAATPLASLRFEYNNLPYKVEPDSQANERGPQVGYNICNSTTQNQNSLCQTAFVNSIDDFCLWAPHEPGKTVGDVEGEMVAWCTKGTHGTRVIPDGALTGVQFIKTPSYLEVTGFINQAFIDMDPTDSGGEMDPHGADARGNPMGGLIFSNQLPSSNGTITQVVEWHNFMGGGAFCIKACDPADKNDRNYCQHIYDRIGCQYNVPAAYKDGVFESCLGDNQDFVGVYTSNGQVMTYQQPGEALGPITSIPYTARIPASSQCTTYQSSALYTDASKLAPRPTNITSSAASSGASSAARTGAPGAVASASGSGSGSNSGSTGAASQLVAVSVGAIVGAAALAIVGAL